MNGASKAVLELVAADDSDFDLEKLVEKLPTDVDEQRELLTVLLVQTSRRVESIHKEQCESRTTHRRLFWISGLALSGSVLAVMVSLGVDLIAALASGIGSGALALLFSRLEG